MTEIPEENSQPPLPDKFLVKIQEIKGLQETNKEASQKQKKYTIYK